MSKDEDGLGLELVLGVDPCPKEGCGFFCFHAGACLPPMTLGDRAEAIAVAARDFLAAENAYLLRTIREGRAHPGETVGAYHRRVDYDSRVDARQMLTRLLDVHFAAPDALIRRLP